MLTMAVPGGSGGTGACTARDAPMLPSSSKVPFAPRVIFASIKELLCVAVGGVSGGLRGVSKASMFGSSREVKKLRVVGNRG